MTTILSCHDDTSQFNAAMRVRQTGEYREADNVVVAADHHVFLINVRDRGTMPLQGGVTDPSAGFAVRLDGGYRIEVRLYGRSQANHDAILGRTNRFRQSAQLATCTTATVVRY